MSILDEIEAHCNGKRLFMVAPMNEIRAYRVPLDKRRRLYVSPEINAFLNSSRRLSVETQADFNDFILGERVQVALELDREFCLMARLQKPSEEVWEIRIFDTKPQLRFFGRFADRDVFVALIGPIGRMKSALNWHGVKVRCISKWNSLFHYGPITKGDNINAYLSNVDLV